MQFLSKSVTQKKSITPWLTLAILAVVSPVDLTADDSNDRRGAAKVFTISPSTHGNPEGIAWDATTQSFFVGGTADGTIYRGKLDDPTISEFIPGAPGYEALGMKVFQKKLYVAGGFAGAVRVYDIESKRLVASFQNFGAGMLNDLVVTQKGDVFVTDSFVPNLWQITAEQVAAGSGVPRGIPVDPEIEYTSGDDPFNLNGIVALAGGRSLIAVQSNNGRLFRIDLDQNAPHGRTIHALDVEPLVGGDGLLLDGSDLIVVQNGPPSQLTFVRLSPRVDSGKVIESRTDPSLRFSSTVARARNFFLVVNADFIESVTPFTVTGLPRNHGEEQE